MAAERGILLRSGEAFQTRREIRKVILDKTGTITRGKPAVVAVLPLPGFAQDEVLSQAAAAENASEHPLARTVVAAAAQSTGIPPATDFQATPGQGVTAVVAGRRVMVGSPRFLAAAGIGLGPLDEQMAARQAAGDTVVALAVDGRPAGLIAIADPLKADAVAACWQTFMYSPTATRAAGPWVSSPTSSSPRYGRL